MPPRTKEDEGRPWTYGLKLRTKAGSPDPVETRHLWGVAAAVADAVGAAGAACTTRTATRAAAAPMMPRARSAERVERTELCTFPAFLSVPRRRGGGSSWNRWG